MQFTIEREHLLKPLQLINGVVERRQTLPILGNVLLAVKDKILSLTGTDLEVELTYHTKVQKASSEGDVTVPARKLFDICRSLPEGSKLNVKVDHHKLYLNAATSRFSLSTLPAPEFPRAKEATDGITITLDVAQLKQMIERTQFAMAQQDVRYYLNGSLWQIEKNVLTTVATDGHRLALCKIPITNQDDPDTAKVIISRKAILEIARIIQDLDKTINIVIGANHVRIVGDDFVLTSKLIDGRFPDYQNVVPRNGQNELKIERDILKPVLARVAILSNEKYRGVRLSLEQNLLKVMANNPEHEEAEELIDVEYSAETMEIGLNVNYLQDALNTMPVGKALFTFSAADRSVLIEHENDSLEALNVVMPMRL